MGKKADRVRRVVVDKRRVAELLRQGLPHKVIAEQMGFTMSAITKAKKRLRL